MQRDRLVSWYNAIVLRVGSFILLDQLQPHWPAIFVCLKLPYSVVCCSPNVAVMDFVPHSAVIRVVLGTMDRYQVDQPIFIRLVIACFYLSLSLDLADDVSMAYLIKPCCTNHICDKPLLYNYPIPIQHQYCLPWSQLGQLWRSSPQLIVLTRSTRVVNIYRRCI